MPKKNAAWDGAVAIVTGGASGIGKALSEELAARGVDVVLADRQVALAEEVARGIRERGGRATAHELNVCDLEAFRRCADATVKRTGRIDYLFNNAGIGVGGEVAIYKPADWDDVFNVNLRGVAYGIQAVYGHMIAQGHGHIVNTASVAGLLPSPEAASYTASKHAVVGLTKALRIEGRRHGVRASALCPGVIRTPILTGGKFGRMNLEGVTKEDILATWERLRPIEPEELARRALDAVARNVAIIIIPSWWKAVWLLDRLLPAVSLRLWGRMYDRLRKDLHLNETGVGRVKEPERPAGELRPL
jgi:NAD(P)-dependent dehydrogenase (short-subunit alcohol dehydrogenase family)